MEQRAGIVSFQAPGDNDRGVFDSSGYCTENKPSSGDKTLSTMKVVLVGRRSKRTSTTSAATAPSYFRHSGCHKAA